MKHWRNLLLWGGLALTLLVVNVGIVRREAILDRGTVLLLPLAICTGDV